MGLVKPHTARRHPLIVGWVWAALTLVPVCGIQYLRGEPLPNPLIAIPIWAVAGVFFGYGLRWTLGRKAGQQ